MKTKIILLTLTLLISLTGFSQDNWMWLNGQVMNDQTNAGEPNHAVYFMVNDSMGGYIYDTAFTDNNGYYGDTLYINSITQGSVQFSTADPCTGNMQYAYQYFSPPFPQDLIQDFLLCEQIPMNCENYFTFQQQSDSLTFVFNGFINLPDSTLYSWDFGDGTTGNGQTITHTFVPQGSNIFQVCLTTETYDTLNNFCMDTSCQDIYIGGGMPCEAFYTAEELNGIPLTWEFTNLSTNVPNIDWWWNFGDGTFSYVLDPIHTFAQAGTYEVCLTISDSLNNCYDEYCEYIVVTDSSSNECENYFTYTSTNQQSFDFEGFFPDTNLMFPYHWEWSFGDGSTAYGQNVSHTFQAGGAAYYTVCLSTWTSVNNDTCWYTSCQDIWVQAAGSCIAGYVYLDSMQYVDEAYVHLLILDSLNGNLMPVETTMIDSNGFYLFDNVSSGNGYMYYTQAELTSNSIFYGQYLPTYHYNAISWTSAGVAVPGGCPGNTYYDISMQEATAANPGAGYIGGTVYNGGTKDIMADMEVLLYNESMEPIMYTYTDANGYYEFDLLAWGSYYVYPEMVGVQSSGFMVVLSEDNPDETINIIIENGSALLSVKENSMVSIANELYPNPSKSNLSFTLEAEYPLNATLSVHSIIGQEMILQQKQLSKGSNKIEMNVSNLPESIYYLRIQVGESKPLMRKFIKID